MRRREFFVGFGAAAAWPLAAGILDGVENTLKNEAKLVKLVLKEDVKIAKCAVRAATNKRPCI